MGLKRTTSPATEPITLAEAKKHVEVALAVTDHDTHLSDMLIPAARERAETYTGRAWITQTWTLTLDRFPAWTIPLPRPPLVSVTSITYVDGDGDTQTLSSSLYRVSTNTGGGAPGRITPAYGEVWPTIRNLTDAVTIVYVAGYGAASSVPRAAKQAILLTVGNWFANREPVVVGVSASEVPQNAKWLLDSLRAGKVPGCYGLAS